MKLLLHTCCAPCLMVPYHNLLEKDIEVKGFWFNPNIHPFTEYEKRKGSLESFAQQAGVEVIWKDEYRLEEFLRGVVFREDQRCAFCYHLRLTETAKYAQRGDFDCFSTTLLFSSHSQHGLIQEIGQQVAADYGVEFFYQDWRPQWKKALEYSKKYGLYRQQYCGCVYSEKERYLGNLKELGYEF